MSRMIQFIKKSVLLLCLMCLSGYSAFAQEAEQEAPSFMVELNNLQATEEGCLISFLVENRLGVDLDNTSFEMVFFDQNNFVDQLIVLDFNGFKQNKLKVRQFNLPETQCSNIGQILVNDIPTCEGQGIDSASCSEFLNAKSRVETGFNG